MIAPADRVPVTVRPGLPDPRKPLAEVTREDLLAALGQHREWVSRHLHLAVVVAVVAVRVVQVAVHQVIDVVAVRHRLVAAARAVAVALVVLAAVVAAACSRRGWSPSTASWCSSTLPPS